jgi:hypothetical protein
MADFELFVDDNYHYMDEQSRYRAGSFASYSEALAAAKAIVDEFLERYHHPGMTSEGLFRSYVGFGEDPFIVPAGETHFSAWDYARARCMELCRDEDAVASVLRYPDWPPELAGFGAVLLAGLGRKDLGAGEHKALEAFRRAIEGYPNAMPRPNSWYWLRLERGSTAFTIYLHPDRFELHAGVLPAAVEWGVRFWGSGRRDRRVGDVAAALEAMRQAALEPDFTLRASGG